MGEESNRGANQLKVFYGFNEDYFKVGQLIKVTVKNCVGVLLEKNYGFITNVEKEKITFIFVGKGREIKEKHIVPADLIDPADLSQKEFYIKVEIIGE